MPQSEDRDDVRRGDNKMRPRLIQFSAVVVAKDHNPSILNKDFLAFQKIVPEDWELAQTISTPPFAQVRYDNGVAITVEQNKLQVTDLGVEDDPLASKAPDIAAAYVKTLPHVRYLSVGLNIQTAIEMTSPETYLKNRFLASGPWDDAEHLVAAAGFRLVYRMPDACRLTLSLDAGEGERTGNERKITMVIANANFHRQCEGYPATDQVLEHLKHGPEDWATFKILLKKVLKVED